MLRSLLLIFSLALLPLISTGCWDRVEIEDRGFVIGVGIDLPQGETEATRSQEKEAEIGTPKGKRRYVITYQFVIPGGLSQSGGPAGGGSATGDAFLNMSTEAASMIEATREFATRTSRSPFFQHIKMVVVSEELARKGYLADVVDFYIRDHEMRRGTNILVAKGLAKDVLHVKPKNEKLPIMFIDSIMENNRKTARMLKPMRIGDLHEKLLENASYAVPRITPEKEEVKIAGAAIFHGRDDQMKGWLGEEETEGLNFLTGDIKGGIIKIKHNENLVAFEIKNATRSIEADVTDIRHIKFKIKIESEGNIVESMETVNYLKPGSFETVTQEVKKGITRLSEDVIAKLQKDFQIDAIGLGSFLSKSHPKVWEKIEEDWESGEKLFARSEIQVDTDVIIRDAGTVTQTDEEHGKE